VDKSTSKDNQKARVINFLKQNTSILIFILLFIIMALASKYFLKWTNLMNIFRQSSVIGTLAIGEAFVIISAGIDLSVGSVAAMCGSIVALGVSQWGFNPVFAILLGLLSAVTIGLINGLLVTKFDVPDFIATLGTSTATVGVALILTNGYPISQGIPAGLLFIGNGSLPGGIPFGAIVFFIIAVLGYIVLRYTTFGRNIFAIGGNREASRVSGINIVRTKIYTMMFSSFCCGIGGIVLLGRLSSASGLMGAGMELNAIAAVVLGGVSINGGLGSIGNVIFGVLTISVLQNGLELLAISAFVQKIVIGSVLVLIVALDSFRRRKLLKV
jgi:ribose/xylose/arabinose/galactoside ABC-type transport system permease subunit